MKGMKGYNPLKLAEELRPKMIDLKNKKVLFAILSGTEQEKDLSPDRFLDDIFRVKLYTKPGEDYFRGEPAGIAAKKLTIPGERIVSPEECNAVFLGQIAGCNLSCWYCYVDRKVNCGNQKYGKFLSAEEYLMQFLLASKRYQNAVRPDYRLNVLRLSGGEVFLVPEIILWLIEAIERFGLEKYIYLRVDCNLMTFDFYWRYLTEEQRKKIRKFKLVSATRDLMKPIFGKIPELIRLSLSDNF
jgi:sulfatase maturation enzyme AslB (radical SAM superfamily)